MKRLLGSALLISLSSLVVAQSDKKEEEKAEISDDIYVITDQRDKADTVSKERLSDRALEVLLEQMYPVKPEAIKEIRKMEIEKLKAKKYTREPRVINDIIQGTTAPGSRPVKILLAPFRTSTLNVVDSTGQPWPITAIWTGSKKVATVTSVPEHTRKNVARLEPVDFSGATNLTMTLADYHRSFSVELEISEDIYHSEPIIQLDIPGPQAAPTIHTEVPSLAHSDSMRQLLIGQTPEGFNEVDVNHSDVEVWTNGDSYFVRSRLFLSYPYPRGIRRGAWGYDVYRIAPSPLLTFENDNGEIIQISVND